MPDTPTRAYPIISDSSVLRVRLGALATCSIVLIGATIWCFKVESNQNRTNRILAALVQVEMAKSDLTPDMKARLLEAVNP